MEEEYWKIIQHEDLEKLNVFLSKMENAGEFINNTFEQGLNGFHKACVMGDCDLVTLLLSFGIDVNIKAKSDGYTPLNYATTSGFEDVLLLLLNSGADYKHVTSDKAYYISGTPIYLSGGQTNLHLAASNANLSCAETLLDWMKSKNIGEDEIQKYVLLKDFDGNSAFDLACMAKAFSFCDFLIPDNLEKQKICNIDYWPPSENWILQKRGEFSKLQAKRIFDTKERKKKENREMIRNKYEPINEILISPKVSKEEIFSILLSQHVIDALSSTEKALEFKKTLQEPVPGIYIADNFFNQNGVELLRNEFSNFLQSGLPVERPNVSIPYGFKVDETGLFNSWLKMIENVISKQLAPILFPEMKELKSSYSFVKHYIHGKDTKPSTHYDPSELTFSVCLGDKFDGSEVYFHEVLQTDTCTKSERTPHPTKCKDCQFIHSHKPGSAVFHVGRHIHGVFPLESGERWQFIMWLYSY